jgi:hypothetical protein
MRLFFEVMRDERLVRMLHIESMAGSEKVSVLHHHTVQQMAQSAALMIRLDHPNLQVSHDLVIGTALAINAACCALAVQWMLSGYSWPQATVETSCSILIRGAIRELSQHHEQSQCHESSCHESS